MKHGESVRIALVISLGGFLFGFDASVISGVIGFVGPQFNLDVIQQGWVVSSPTFAAMFAMLLAGTLSDKLGRRRILIYVAFLYAISALFSALAPSYYILVVARMVGGLAFGAALVIAPIYIAELSPPEQRGKLVSIQQLNIVLGFSASYFSNYFILQLLNEPGSFINEFNIWRIMLGIELIPAAIYFGCLFFVPKSPRWLLYHGKEDEAMRVLEKMHGHDSAEKEKEEVLRNIEQQAGQPNTTLSALFSKEFRFIMVLALIIAVVQQVTGINSILFYATTIFEQSGVGKNAAFAQAILVGLVQVVFTLVTMTFIDKVGRKPLMLIGLMGIAISMFIAAYGFHQATFSLTPEKISQLPESIPVEKLDLVHNKTYQSDLEFKRAMRDILGDQVYAQNESVILEVAVEMNAILVLIGILGFMASFLDLCRACHVGTIL